LAALQADNEVYQFYVGLCEVTPAVWRRLLVRADSTICDLPYILQLAFGWSDSHKLVTALPAEAGAVE
jgi:hypothetical protein